MVLAGCENTGERGLARGQSTTAFSVGGAHACLRVIDGTLRCFGSNAAGQLGIEPDADAGVIEPTAPRVVTGLSGVAGIAAGGAHTCVRLDDQTVRCFGSNEFGQLGDGTHDPHPTPVVVPSLRGARDLCAGGAHACAILADKSVSCWGRNDDGQLGDGTNVSRSTPVRANGVDSVEQLACGTFHTCARRADGAVFCWGRDDHGQIGDGTTGTPHPRPTQVVGLALASAIAAGLDDSCAILPDRTLRCWGSAVSRATPSAVLGFDSVAAVTIGASATSLQLCARLTSGSIRCASSGKSAPALVPGIVDADDLAGGASFTCARLKDGSVRCFAPGGEPFAVVP